jgi:hypothetical protein
VLSGEQATTKDLRQKQMPLATNHQHKFMAGQLTKPTFPA